MSKNNLFKDFSKGILIENPVLVLGLGLCPALAVTSSAVNGLGMGVAATFVLLMSNIIVSLIKPLVPPKIRIPIFILVIATFVTIVKLVMAAYTPALSEALGIFIPLIVVNCMILGRAEAFASKHGPLRSTADALGMGLGFSLTLVLLGAFRELIGEGSIFGHNLMGSSYQPALLMILPPGAFLSLGMMVALSRWILEKTTPKGGEC
ncbi:MAG TPA: electron transport complex subunit E [candidate division Zixibacteria bacterium]|nr:electron transport complex subunit E [candidate division Zixibacteria bacterium]